MNWCKSYYYGGVLLLILIQGADVMLYQVAFLEKGNESKEIPEKLLFDPIWVIANSSNAAAVKAVIDNKDRFECNTDKLEVVICPFG